MAFEASAGEIATLWMCVGIMLIKSLAALNPYVFIVLLRELPCPVAEGQATSEQENIQDPPLLPFKAKHTSFENLQI